MRCRQCLRETNDLARVPVHNRRRITFLMEDVALCPACQSHYFSKRGIFIVTDSKAQIVPKNGDLLPLRPPAVELPHGHPGRTSAATVRDLCG